MINYKFDSCGDLVVYDTENKVSVTVENTIKDLLKARQAIWLINNHVLKTSRDLIEYLDQE